VEGEVGRDKRALLRARPQPTPPPHPTTTHRLPKQWAVTENCLNHYHTHLPHTQTHRLRGMLPPIRPVRPPPLLLQHKSFRCRKYTGSLGSPPPMLLCPGLRTMYACTPINTLSIHQHTWHHTKLLPTNMATPNIPLASFFPMFDFRLAFPKTPTAWSYVLTLWQFSCCKNVGIDSQTTANQPKQKKTSHHCNVCHHCTHLWSL